MAACLVAKGQKCDFEVETFIAHSLRGEGFDASEDGTGRGTPLVPVAVALRGRDGGATIELGDDQAFALRASSGGGDKPHVLAFDTTQVTSAANRSNPQPGDPCHPLAAGAHAPAVAFSGCDFGGDAQVEFTPTLRVGSGAGKMGGGQKMSAMVGMQVRRLTPRECERLQGFPDDYTQVPNRGKPAADGPRYKALGNSMAVPCMAWIGRRIQAVEALQATTAA